jgi:hypothetical protein
MSIFTFSERTVKNKTVSQAVSQATEVLKSKGVNTLCTNKVLKRDYNEKITVQELSNLTDDLICDTLYHEGYI